MDMGKPGQYVCIYWNLTTRFSLSLRLDVHSMHTVMYVLHLLLHYFPVQSLSRLLHKCVVPRIGTTHWDWFTVGICQRPSKGRLLVVI